MTACCQRWSAVLRLAETWGPGVGWVAEEFGYQFVKVLAGGWGLC